MLSKKIVWKLNIIDILLLAIIFLSVCALIYKATRGGDDEYRTYEASYVCENIPIEILSGLESGMACSDYDSGSDLGVLKRVDYKPIEEQADSSAASDKTDDRSNKNEDENKDEDEDSAPEPTNEPTHARAVLVTEVEGARAEHGVKTEGIVLLKALKLDLIVGDTVLNVYVNEIK